MVKNPQVGQRVKYTDFSLQQSKHRGTYGENEHEGLKTSHQISEVRC